MPTLMHSVNVMLSEKDRADADLLAAAKDLNRSSLMRSLIRSARKHVLEHCPTCSSGEACRAPHLIQYAGKPHDFTED